MSGKKSKKFKKNRSHSRLDQHVVSGKMFTPPLLTLPNLQKISWMNDRLPELLWAVLLVGNMERKAALEILRSVARLGANFANDRDMGGHGITLSGIASMPEKVRDSVIEAITSDPTSRIVLRVLTTFRDLPSRDLWLARLGPPVSPVDWIPLMNAVALTLDHQSQESTDCRWVPLYFKVASGRLHLPADEMVQQIADYPYLGDQRMVRPFIRASEGVLNTGDKDAAGWSEKFWAQCLHETPCLPSSGHLSKSTPNAELTLEALDRLAEHLVEHARLSLRTSGVDPKYDTVFGTALYCVNILRELVGLRANESVLARMGLRTVLECYVTLAYLIKKNDKTLWNSYRVYGAGQGKLAFLKMEALTERPSYVSVNTLDALANEDQWLEFLPIDVGHWNKSTLRSMSDIAGVKADYDRYYSWPSAYVHGHWGAIRDSAFTTCLNPLHRLHRILLPRAKRLGDVVPDVASLANKVLALVHESYPAFEVRLAAQVPESE